jgi:putative transposase
LIPARNQSVIVRPANGAKELFKSQRLRVIRVKSKAVFDFDDEINSIWSMISQEDFYRGRHVIHRLSVHLVFITKYRKGAITERVWKALRVGFQTASEKLGVKLREANHNTDHVHLVIDYPPNLSVSEIVNALKGVSSRIARRDCMPEIHKALWGIHFWSPSYFAASCGGAPLELIQQYVQNQRDRPSTPA